MVLRQQKNMGGLRCEIMETLSFALNKQLLRELDYNDQQNFDINTRILFPLPTLVVTYKGLMKLYVYLLVCIGL
jgi:hypothetical protein